MCIRDRLESLPGVGHKTASVVMSQGFGNPAFPVDTHIHRLAQRWGLTNGKSVIQTEEDLKRLFPKKNWNKLHLQIIYYGREYCKARGCYGLSCKICTTCYPNRKNPVKINATKKAFEDVFTDHFEFEGVSADSLVSDQPMSNDETLKGATNRLQNIQHLEADYLVSIEGGVDLLDNNYEAFAWIVISDKSKIGKAKTATFPLPLKISNLIKEGYELGDADDMVFKRSNSKQKNGAVGILTDNLINRTDYYAHAIILALIPFSNTKLY